jgi:hypothetical protein
VLIITVHPLLFGPASITIVVTLGALSALVDDHGKESESGLATVAVGDFLDVELEGVLDTVLDLFA